jgi:uncharacterized delta-60 repeat protein
MLFLFLVLAHPMRAQSALDGFDPNANGLVRVVVVQPDGKILVGGDFTTVSPNGGTAVTRNHIARLNPDGTLDTAFDPNANDIVYAIALQPDGKILVGGAFNGANSIGGGTRNRIARLDATTGLADSYDPNANHTVYAIALQADFQVLVGGDFNGANSIGGQSRDHIARLDASTGLADSFNPTADGLVRLIAVQADGRILAGGGFSSIGGQTRSAIARLDASTGLADSFDSNSNGQLYAMAIQADGKILVGGNFSGPNSIGGATRNNIARLDPMSGSADSFDPNANAIVYAISVQADGKILVGGSFAFSNSIGGQPRNRIARLDPTTGLADSFNPNATSSILSIAVQADGKVVAGGNFNGANSIDGQMRNRIARLEIDGRLDQTLNLGIDGSFVTAIVGQPDGKTLIGGLFTSVLGVPRNNIARLNTDGTLDTAFNPNSDSWVRAIAIQADGKVLVGGDFANIGGHSRKFFARLDAVTGEADLFDPNPNDIVEAIAVQPDGGILAAGTFTSIGGQPWKFFARLNPTSGLADSFDAKANDRVGSMVVQPDGKIVVIGNFNGIGGQARHGIARLDPTSGLADSFNPDPDSSSVIAVARQADGKILAGGDFTSIGGQPRNNLARLDATTGLADSFDPNADFPVYSIALQADGKILVGGLFTSIGGQPRNYLARLDATTGLADSFDSNAGYVLSLALQADAKVLVGGEFNSIGGEQRQHFARLSNDTATLQNLAVTRSTITWTLGGANPGFGHVTFEYSSDQVNYTSLANATAAGSSWIVTGLNLPTGQNLYIRARGYCSTGYANGSAGITESVRKVFLPTPGDVGNVSTRLPVGAGDDALFEGFIVDGPAGSTKKIIVRAIGPSLIPFGIADALTNPTLEIRDASGAMVAMNNDWKTTQVGGLITGDQVAEINSTGVAPSDDRESAIVADLAPGSYTAVVRGVNNTTGTGVVDAYDLNGSSPAKLANIATRGLVQAGDKLMIAGFIVQNAPVRAVVRAIGPSLQAFGINNALGDTTLELRDQHGEIVIQNDDWKLRMDGSSQQAELEATGLQPSHDLEAALVADIAPGLYTAQVRGKNDTSGIGVVQVYFLQ